MCCGGLGLQCVALIGLANSPAGSPHRTTFYPVDLSAPTFTSYFISSLISLLGEKNPVFDDTSLPLSPFIFEGGFPPPPNHLFTTEASSALSGFRERT